MRSSSVLPGASILPFWSVSTARKASGPSPHGRQNRPDSLQAKKSRTSPPGNALLYIATVNDFFQTRRALRGAFFVFPSGKQVRESLYKKRRPAFVGGAADKFQIPKVRESFYQHFLFPDDVEAARQSLGGLGGSGVLAQLHPAERVDVHGGIVVVRCFADAVPLAIIV